MEAAMPGEHRRWRILALAWFLAGAVFLLPLSPALGRDIGREESEAVCRGWLDLLAASAPGPAALHPLPTAMWELCRDGRLLARCYPLDPKGHLLVAADDLLPPVPVFSADSDLDPGASPEVVESLASRLAAALDEAGMKSAADRERVRAVWSLLLDPSHPFQAGSAQGGWTPDPAGSGESPPGLIRAQAGPLLATRWHQRAPYDLLCPNGDGGRTAVGCGPLAVAQIMRYHAWPPRGHYYLQYIWNGDQSCGGDVGGGILEASLTDPYDWESMPEDCAGGCDGRERDALSEICYEVGVAAMADYGACGTSTQVPELTRALWRYLFYTREMAQEKRSDHTPLSWFELIRGEVDQGCPVLYSITGHALVCDGWMELGGSRQIHVNWGDGGAPYTGWWDVDGLPTGQDPLADGMVRGIRPSCTVAADGSGYFHTIQEAIDQVPAGAVILLIDGVYSGIGNRDLDTRGKALEIRSASLDPSLCILDCGGTPAQPHRGFRFYQGEGEQTRIRGLTIRNGYATLGGGLLCEGGASPVLEDLCLESNQAYQGGGAACLESRPVFRGVRMEGNRAFSGGGLYAEGGAPVVDSGLLLGNEAEVEGGAVRVGPGTAVLTGSTLYGNRAPEGSGIHAGSGAVLRADHCILVQGGSGAAVSAGEGARLDFSCCDLYGNEGGDWVGPVSHLAGENGNLEEDPLFCDPAERALTLHLLSPRSEYGNPGCGRIGALGPACGEGAVVTLFPDGSGSFPTIQAAVDAAFDQVILELAPGIYSGPGNRDVVLGGRSLEIRGATGDPADCILDCGPDGEVPHRAFLLQGEGGVVQIFRGITFRNGAGPDKGDDEDLGGGAVLSQGAEAVFEDCVFQGNLGSAGSEVSAFGGAVRGIDASLSFLGCLFESNRGSRGGAVAAGGGSLRLTDCTIRSNSASGHGGGIHAEGCDSAVLERCVLEGNSAEGDGTGGGLCILGTDARLEGCAFLENRAARGGAVLAGASCGLLAEGCTFAWNHAEEGGALYGPSLPVWNECTFYENEAASGSAFFGTGSYLDCQRTLITGGLGGDALVCSRLPYHTIRCTDIYGNSGRDWLEYLAPYLGRDGNICMSPGLCDPGSGGFQIESDSPCAPGGTGNAGCGRIGAWEAGCGPGEGEPPDGALALVAVSRPRPNPSEGAVRYQVWIPAPAGRTQVDLEVFDASGRLVWSGARGLPPGAHELIWNGRDGAGRLLPSGVYLARIRAGGSVSTDRLVVLR